jgi:hypothetical protein
MICGRILTGKELCCFERNAPLIARVTALVLLREPDFFRQTKQRSFSRSCPSKSSLQLHVLVRALVSYYLCSRVSRSKQLPALPDDFHRPAASYESPECRPFPRMVSPGPCACVFQVSAVATLQAYRKTAAFVRLQQQLPRTRRETQRCNTPLLQREWMATDDPIDDHR